MHLTPPIVLSNAITPADIIDIATLRQSTFLTSQLSILRFGKVPSEELTRWLVKGTELEFADAFKHRRIASNSQSDPSLLHEEHLVVRDLDLPPCSNNLNDPTSPANSEVHSGRIVAQAEWRYNPPTTSPIPNTTQEDNPSNPPPSSANKPLITHFNTLVESTLAALIDGIPCYELRNIFTASSHVRRGIAKQLVTWVFPFADRDQLPIILAASPMGHHLYRACGFQELTGSDGEALACTLDMGEWGGECVHHHVLMARWPTGWTGTRDWEEYKRSVKR